MKLLHKLLPDSYYIHPRYLSIYRIIYCCIILLLIGIPAYSWIGESLDYFYRPPRFSAAGMLGGFPGRAFFLVLGVVNLLAFIFMFWGFFCRSASIIFSISCIVGHNFKYSFGKIDHDLLFLIVPIFAAWAGWGAHYSIDAFREKKYHLKAPSVSKEQNSMIISLFAICIGFSMFTAGLQKISGGWADWDAEAVRGHLFQSYYGLEKNQLLSNIFLGIDNHLIWKGMDYSALVMELGFLISVFRRNFFRCFLAMAVVFHVFVFLMFNIIFFSNLIAYLLFVDWKLVEKQVKAIMSHVPLLRQKLMFKLLIGLASLMCFVWMYLLLADIPIFKYPSFVNLILQLLPGIDVQLYVSIVFYFFTSLALAFYLNTYWIYIKEKKFAHLMKVNLKVKT